MGSKDDCAVRGDFVPFQGRSELLHFELEECALLNADPGLTAL